MRSFITLGVGGYGGQSEYEGWGEAGRRKLEDK
jgi:hypothetical protein